MLIAGPTASGKSALALKLARERDGVIINADSMQVYRELRILSARPSTEEEAAGAAPALWPCERGGGLFGGALACDAKLEMQACWAIGKLPIVVGGTGLYFMALQGGLAEVPPIPEDVRERVAQFCGRSSCRALQKRDPVGAAKLNPADRQRIIRALEVFEATGKPCPHWQADAQVTGFPESDQCGTAVCRCAA